VLIVGGVLTGLVNALIHAKDAWAVMPLGLMLSTLVALLAMAAASLGLTMMRRTVP
jgi:membrane protease YdiL (CAAX protease family)